LGQEPTYSKEDARYLQGLPNNASSHIHWAYRTAKVDIHGMPTFEPTTGPPSTAGTAVLLDKDVLYIMLSAQHAEQG